MQPHVSHPVNIAGSVGMAADSAHRARTPESSALYGNIPRSSTPVANSDI